MPLMGTSTLVVFLGLGLGWILYGDRSPKPEEPDVLETAAPVLWGWLRDRLYVDELYGVTVIAFYKWWARVADWLDRRVWGGVVAAVAWAFRGWAQFNRLLDTNGWMAALTKVVKSWPQAVGCFRGCRRDACKPT